MWFTLLGAEKDELNNRLFEQEKLKYSCFIASYGEQLCHIYKHYF